MYPDPEDFPEEAELVNSIDFYFTAERAIWNNSYIDVMFPFEIDFDNAIKGDLSDVTEEYPWVEIECEMIQSMDPDIICMLELNVTERDCNNTNLIRVYNAFKGDTLVYTEPDITQ